MDEKWWSVCEKRAGRGCVTDQRVARVILHPLTEIGVGMFMPVVVGRRQLVMNLQRSGERRHREQHARENKRNDRAGFEVGAATKHGHPV